VPLLFAATLFVSASLLFMVQPMVGKMVLPLLGGSPAVWNACMVFFQLLLLLGYQYAHFVTGKYDTKRQWLIHLAVLALPLAAFVLSLLLGARHSPIAIVESLAPSGQGSPVLSVLALLTVAIAIPFFVISTSAPLLQKWFAYTGHPSARDPYFLYSASNLGSMISLLGYPLLIEPNLSIVGQAWLFAGGFVVLAGMIFVCGRAATHPIGTPPVGAVLTSPPRGATKPDARASAGRAEPTPVPAPPSESAPDPLRKLRWVFLAFVPSTLMLGVTFHMTTDIASIPLLWVGPLALYLLTFIIAFGRVPDWFRVVIGNLAPVLILLLVFVLISGVNPGVGITLLLHMLTFFAAALMCHYELARDRPSPKYLTGYFLLMSIGGVLGGVFNSLVAPLVFPHAFEYPIALIAACLMVPRLVGGSPEAAAAMPADRGRSRQQKIALALDLLIPVLLGVTFHYLRLLPTLDWFESWCKGVATTLSLAPETIRVIFVFAVPVMICFFFVDRPLRFALCVLAVLGYSSYREASRGLIHSERSFFGILKIEEDVDLQRPIFRDEDGKLRWCGQIEYYRLVHGTTLHGTQVRKLDNNVLDMFQAMTALHPWDNIVVAGANHAFNPREEPLTYYHRTGPVGAMVSELRTRKGGADAKSPFAMVGLGTGSASCYVLPGQRLTFYEIDPAVKHLVADTDAYFSYVTDGRRRARLAPGGDLDIRMGDARLKLKEDTDARYSLLLVDAFSSDSIPVHLLTVEAVQLYLDRMPEDGILALHISNKFVRLEPVVSAIAKQLGIDCRVWNDDGERRPGKTASSWVVLARKREYLGRLYSPIGDLVFPTAPDARGNERMQVSMEGQLFMGLVADHDELLGTGTRKAKYLELNEASDPKAAWLAWVTDKLARTTDPVLRQRLQMYEDLITRYGPSRTFQEVMILEHGHAFRKLEVMTDVPAWTDDYSDVLRVMMIPELQRVRKFFGLPTPIER